MQFWHKKHWKRISKTRDMKIRNLDRITKLEMRKLNKETNNVKGRTRQVSQTMMFDKPWGSPQ